MSGGEVPRRPVHEDPVPADPTYWPWGVGYYRERVFLGKRGLKALEKELRRRDRRRRELGGFGFRGPG